MIASPAPARPLSWLVARPIAHRGLHDMGRGVIENTASAFARAIERNYGIECDLQLTADGEAVVFHDETLDRLTEARGPVLARRLDELKAIPIKGTKDRIQTLAELIRQVNGTVPLVIEIKSHWDGNPALVKRSLDVLRLFRGKFALMSFDPAIVELIRRLSPTTPRGLVADRYDDPWYGHLPRVTRMELKTYGHLPRTRPDFLSFHHSELPFAPVAEFRSAGHPVITWTLRSPGEARRALRYSDQVTFEGYLP